MAFVLVPSLLLYLPDSGYKRHGPSKLGVVPRLGQLHKSIPFGHYSRGEQLPTRRVTTWIALAMNLLGRKKQHCSASNGWCRNSNCSICSWSHRRGTLICRMMCATKKHRVALRSKRTVVLVGFEVILVSRRLITMQEASCALKSKLWTESAVEWLSLKGTCLTKLSALLIQQMIDCDTVRTKLDV